MQRTSFIASALFLFFISGCAPKNDPPPPRTEIPQAVLTADVPPGVLSSNYIDAATALAADDMDKAKDSLNALAMESTGELQALAEKAAKTGDIMAMRETFKALSVLATAMELPEGYAVAYCPMYKGGAKWVQKKDKLANPYFGNTMLTCGSFIN